MKKKFFLEEVVEYTLRKYPDLRKLSIIFPNRRAGLYFQKALAKKNNKTLWSPNVQTLEEFVQDHTNIKISDDLEAELAEGSSKGLVELKEAPKDIEPEDIKKVDFRKQRARSDNTVGVTFARLGNYSMAIDYFKKAINNDSKEMDYKVNLAVALYRMYKYDDALEYYDEVKKAKPELVTQLDFIETMGESTPKFDKFD